MEDSAEGAGDLNARLANRRRGKGTGNPGKPGKKLRLADLQSQFGVGLKVRSTASLQFPVLLSRPLLKPERGVHPHAKLCLLPCDRTHGNDVAKLLAEFLGRVCAGSCQQVGHMPHHPEASLPAAWHSALAQTAASAPDSSYRPDS